MTDKAMTFEEALAGNMSCLNSGCEGIPPGHCYHFQNLRAAHAREVAEAEQRGYAHGSESIPPDILDEAESRGIRKGRAEAFREAAMMADCYDGLVRRFAGVLEQRAAEESK